MALVCAGVFCASFMDAIGGGGGIISLPCYLPAFCYLAKLDVRTASSNVKLVNLASNVGALATSLSAGKVLLPIGLLAAVFSTAGQYLGAGLALKNGSKIVRPVILVVLVLLTGKVLLELFGI